MGDLASVLRAAGTTRGEFVGLAVAPDGTAAVVPAGRVDALAGDASGDDPSVTNGWVGPASEVAAVDRDIRPRWVTWSGETAGRLIENGVRIATCWDVAAVHRLLSGGWRADPGLAWASVHGLPSDGIPTRGQGDLFDSFEHGSGTAGDHPVGPSGYLDPEWSEGGWASSEQRLRGWARLAHEAAALQRAALARSREPAGAREDTALSESTAELLCAELAADGLPVRREIAESLLTQIIGRRPRDDAEAARIRADRDEKVLRHAPPGVTADLRSPVQVKTLLKRGGIDVPDTRAWRLEQYKDGHPLVAALLEWRKAERVATTYGYAWLDSFLGADGRLRGSWTGSDGAAGRMTASAGLHNMPVVLRQAVIAEDGHVFIRADLGQIEPRVLAAVSRDSALIEATTADDLYLPVAKALNVDRPTAKVAMIAAMYGQTTGHGGQAARRMKAAYPVAMGYLDDADRRAQKGIDLRTYGGRLVRMSAPAPNDADGPMPSAGRAAESSARVAARGRYGRNAMIQGAAAELFKMWAVTVRARGEMLAAHIVLCLHDELLVHVPEDRAAEAMRLVSDCLAETTRRWSPGSRVRFLADITTVRCWAEAKVITGTDNVTESISGQEGA